MASILTIPREIRGLIYEYLDDFDKLNVRESLKLFRKEIQEIKNVVRKDALIVAATRGYFSILKHRGNKKYIWPKKGPITFLNMHTQTLDLATVSIEIGKRGDTTILVWLRNNNFRLDLDAVCLGACQAGKLEIVKWCWKTGASPGHGHILTAKANRHFNVASWLSNPR